MYNSLLRLNSTKNAGEKVDFVYTELCNSKGSTEEAFSSRPDNQTYEIVIKHAIRSQNARRLEELLLDMIDSGMTMSAGLACRVIGFYHKYVLYLYALTTIQTEGCDARNVVYRGDYAQATPFATRHTEKGNDC